MPIPVASFPDSVPSLQDRVRDAASVLAGGVVLVTGHVDGRPCHALAHLDCELAESVPIADHVLCIGRVTEVIDGTSAHPLVYFGRGYRRLAIDEKESP